MDDLFSAKEDPTTTSPADDQQEEIELDAAFDKSEDFEREVKPVIEQLAETCKRLEIPYVAAVLYANSDTEERIFGSTGILHGNLRLTMMHLLIRHGTLKGVRLILQIIRHMAQYVLETQGPETLQRFCEMLGFSVIATGDDDDESTMPQPKGASFSPEREPAIVSNLSDMLALRQRFAQRRQQQQRNDDDDGSEPDFPDFGQVPRPKTLH